MEIKIQSTHFNITEKLEVSIEEKVGKLEKTSEDVRKVEVQLRLIRPVAALNKQTAITVAVPGSTLFVEKTCDTLEEDIDLCVDAMRIQISEYKEKMRAH